MSVKWTAAAFGICALAAAAQSHEPNLVDGGNAWRVTAFLDEAPDHARQATQRICFVDDGFTGTHRRYRWYSTTYPGWRGRAAQEGDQIFMHGDYADGVGHDVMVWEIVTSAAKLEGAGHWLEWRDDGVAGTTVGFANAKFRRLGRCRLSEEEALQDDSDSPGDNPMGEIGAKVVSNSVTIGLASGPPTSGPELPLLLGVNGSPEKEDGDTYRIPELYKQVAISSVRTHDEAVDPCKAHKDDTVELNHAAAGSCNPATVVSDSVVWSSNTTPPSDTYNFAAISRTIDAINDAGANVYLRLGESHSGPDQVKLASDYATVAARLTSEVNTLGTIEFVEIWNEPDSIGFWEESTGPTEFYDLYGELVTAAALPLGLETGGSGFTTGGMAAFRSTDVVKDWPTLSHPDGRDFVSGHYYGECDKELPAITLTAREMRLVAWLDAVNTELAGINIDVPLHVTEWNLDEPSSGCSLFGTAPHASYVAAALILMSLPEYDIKRSHYYPGIGKGGNGLFMPDGAVVKVNPAAFGFWGYKSLASRVRLDTTQSWGSGSGSAADAARAGQQWFAIAGSTSTGESYGLIANDSSQSEDLRVTVAWGPSGSMTVRQVSSLGPIDVATTLSGSVRTVSAGDAAAAFDGAISESTKTFIASGSESYVDLTLPSHSVTVLEF